MAETINRTKTQTFQQITFQQDIKDILKQPTITLKERHSGLTIKFNNDIAVDLISKVKISQTEHGEVVRQTETNERKSANNFKRYTYNVVTIFENEKIKKIRKEIFNLENQLKIKKTQYDNLNSTWIQIINNLVENEYYELNFLNNKLKIIAKNKVKKWENNCSLRKLYSLKEQLKKVKINIAQQEKQKDEITKSKKVLNYDIQKIELRLSDLKEKLYQYSNEINVPSLSLQDKINRRLQLQRKFEEENLSVKVKEKILENIYVLKNEIKKEWSVENKKIKKMYEEILPIEDKIFFITTFLHTDQSITEELFHFYEDNDEIEVIRQIKYYKDINEYKKNTKLIEDISTNNNNVFFSKMSIKKFLIEQQNNSFNISRTEWIIFISVAILSIILLSCVPVASFFVFSSLWSKVFLSIIGITISWTVNNWMFTLVKDKTKKVQVWMRKKFFSLVKKIPFMNKENMSKTKKEEQIKNNIKKTMQRLISDKIKTKLEVQYEIWKQELSNRRYKNTNELICSKVMFQNKNNLKDTKETDQDFDSSIRTSVNDHDQPLINRTVHSSNLRI